MSDEDLLDLTAAERTLRKLADDARVDHAAGHQPDDLFECYRLVIDELDRVRGRLRELQGEGPEERGRQTMRAPAMAADEPWGGPEGDPIGTLRRFRDNYAIKVSVSSETPWHWWLASEDELVADVAVAAMPREWHPDVEPVDGKGRGPSYWRGFADGRMAEWANNPAHALESRGVLAEIEDEDEDEIDDPLARSTPEADGDEG